jgi:hypothetical protein
VDYDARYFNMLTSHAQHIALAGGRAKAITRVRVVVVNTITRVIELAFRHVRVRIFASYRQVTARLESTPGEHSNG